MRNRIIHCYDDIEIGLVWRTCNSALRDLQDQLEKVLA